MNKLKYSLTVMALSLLAFSCSKDDVAPQNEETWTEVYTLDFDSFPISFCDSTTKAGEFQWPDGAKLYIMFSNKENTMEYPGTATYSSTTNKWTIPAPQGELHRGDSTSCKVIYIEKEAENGIINLTTDDVIYEDASAKYLLGSETLTIRANLTPKTARIRFKGDAGSTIKLYGIASYNKYNTNFNTFGISDKELELAVAQDGYTPYIHVFFPNDTRRLEITDSNDNIFVFKCSSRHLSSGMSRYFTIPTQQDRQGWTMYEPIRTFKVNDVEFKMIYVQWINGSYYIAETETTQKLWYTVTSENPSQFKDDNSDLPVESANETDYNLFQKKLQEKTGYPFSLPTFDQWLFAAKGGNKSRGYTYSGSNTIDDIAWYKNNSEGTTHLVKLKMPNELGLYDMNGNVAEVVLEYDNYYRRYIHRCSYGGDYSLSITDWVEYFELNPDISGNSEMYRYSFTESGYRLCLNI